MLNAKAVNFTRGALDQAQIIIARQVQGNTVVVDAVGGCVESVIFIASVILFILISN